MTNRNGKIAVAQIFLMVISIVAIAYMIGFQTTIVSAGGQQCFNVGQTSWIFSPGYPLVNFYNSSQQLTQTQFCKAYPSNCKASASDPSVKVVDTSKNFGNCPTSSNSGGGSGGGNTIGTLTQAGAAANSGVGLFDRFVGGKTASAAATSTGTLPATTFGGSLFSNCKGLTCSGPTATVTPPANPTVTAAIKKSIWSRLGSALTGGSNAWATLGANAVAAIATYYAAQLIIKGFHISNPREVSTINAFGKAGAAGWIAHGVALALGASGPVGWIIGGAVLLVTFFTGGAGSYVKTYTFTCVQWEPPAKGGSNCARCNNQGIFPCTAYECQSLGQDCQLLNQGTSHQLCEEVKRLDVNPPEIQSWQQVLTTGYSYTPNNAITLPDKGVKIVPTGKPNGCVAAFTPLEFGVTTNEPAICKVDVNNTGNFTDMQGFFGNAYMSFNHSMQLSLPSPAAVASANGSYNLDNGGLMNFYVRCRDANGNANLGTFSFSFCVDKGPDKTPPIIVTTSIANGAPIGFQQNDTDLTIYTNEPSTCSWSKLDKSYKDMENPMSCDTGVFDYNNQQLYKCSTTLTGLKDRVNNTFYFRCEDQPWLAGTSNESERNADQTSYVFSLMGTQKLILDSASPNDTTISDSTNVIKVTLDAVTSAGYDNGNATCYYSDTGDSGSYVQFYNTATYNSTQDLYLPSGDYTYYIKCIDLGGNAVTTKLKFNVKVDNTPPIVVGAYHESNSLALVTDENATCVYGTTDCNYDFNDGIAFTETMANGGTIHTTSWVPDQTLYVKCQDRFGNQPDPNKCSIEVRPAQPQSQSS